VHPSRLGLLLSICAASLALSGCSGGMTPFGSGSATGPGSGPVSAPTAAAPIVQAYAVAPNGMLEVQFNEAMNPATIDAESFTVANRAGERMPGTVSYDPNFDLAIFVPKPALKRDASYKATITTAVAAVGGVHLAKPYSFTFIVSSLPIVGAPISVSSVTPAPNAACVGASTAITIAFNQAPEATTLTAKNLTVSGPDGAISVKMSANIKTTVVVLTPISPLPSGTITVTVSKVSNLAGQSMTSPYTWSFSTTCGTSATGTEYLYMNATGTQNLYAYVIEPKTGILSPISAAPFQFSTGAAPTLCGMGCAAPIVADPLGRFLFYAFTWPTNSGFGAITIDPASGALINNSVLVVTGDNYGAPQGGISTDPQGRFLLGAVQTNHPAAGTQSWLRSVQVASSGELSLVPGEPFPFEGTTDAGLFEGVTAPASPAVSSQYAYVSGTLQSSATSQGILTGFSISQASGLLALAGQTADGAAAYTQVIAPSGKFLYSEQWNNATRSLQIVGFGINADGSLTQLPQPPQLTPDQSGANLIVAPNGNFLYHVGATHFTAGSAKEIRDYSIDPSTGLLTLMAVYPDIPFAADETLYIDPAAQYVYIPEVNRTTIGYTLAGFSANPATGILTPISGAQTPLPAQPAGVAIVRPQ
jgi:hypothetical protein